MMKNDSKIISILSFYSFINIDETGILQQKLLLLAKKKYIYGTILLAREGFNGTISGDHDALNLLLKEITNLTNARNVISKFNYCDKQPFSKIKVKLKDEIVALKYGDLDIDNLKGEYIDPQDWDDFIQRDDVITIDTRNDYEVNIGTFKGAIDPETETFNQLAEWTQENISTLKGKKVAMFCTGGIRCEKSTALLKEMGVDDTYHLKGGILQYLEDTKNKNQLWQGDCFVFDDRGAVDEYLKPSEDFWVKKGQTAKAVSRSKLS